MKSIAVKVNGELFVSARAAARFIVEEESKVGNRRKEDTIAKELKRCFKKNGGHVWAMYDRYVIEEGE